MAAGLFVGTFIAFAMYTDYFGLKEKPFSIAPDPRYFFTSEGHREALAHLLYGIQSEGGLVLLTGEVGTGKTTVCRLLLDLIPGDMETAFILNPKVTAEELLASVCDEFGIPYPVGTKSIKSFVSLINDFLLHVHQGGRKAVLIIEEAQNLSIDVLEQVRLLTNLETKERKLLQVIMVGQPELRDALSRPELRQLSQRVTARYHLGPLSRKEVPLYVQHRLSVAGLHHGHPFPPSTLNRLFTVTKGVPRLINIVLDRALLGAFVEGKDRVDRKTLRRAVREVTGQTDHGGRLLPASATAGIVLIVCALSVFSYYILPGSKTSSKTETPSLAAAHSPWSGARIVEGTGGGKPGTIREDTGYQAWGTLFSLWHATYRPGDDSPCEQAAAQGLLCVEGKSTLASLRRINRPVVMDMRNDRQGIDHAVLTGLDTDRATLVRGQETIKMSVKELEQKWTGNYLLLWRGTPKVEQLLKPGTKSPFVGWLDAQLAVLQGRRPASRGEQIYDEELTRQVKAFQKNAGIRADGIVGPDTVMHITALAGDGSPVLQKRAGP